MKVTFIYHSSYFVELSTALQDNIISRTAMDL